MTKFKTVEHPSEYFDQLQWNDKLAVAASYEESRSKAKNLSINSKKSIYCFRGENIIYEHSLKILTRKNFPLLNNLNNFIRQASESGLIEKWLKHYQSIRDEKSEIEYITVQTETLLIELVIFCCMMSLASLAVILERKTFQKTRAPNATPFWRYLEMSIDPYRYFFMKRVEWHE